MYNYCLFTLTHVIKSHRIRPMRYLLLRWLAWSWVCMARVRQHQQSAHKIPGQMSEDIWKESTTHQHSRALSTITTEACNARVQSSDIEQSTYSIVK